MNQCDQGKRHPALVMGVLLEELQHLFNYLKTRLEIKHPTKNQRRVNPSPDGHTGQIHCKHNLGSLAYNSASDLGVVGSSITQMY